MVSFEDFLLLFGCCFLAVARLKEALDLYQVVAGPLVPIRSEKCVSKVISVVGSVGGAAPYKKGRTTPCGGRQYDNTKGYPGEDICIWFL